MTDIFISYARDDDVPPPDRPDRKGFVTFLDENIRYEFRDLGPERPVVWRDVRRISPGDAAVPLATFGANGPADGPRRRSLLSRRLPPLIRGFRRCVESATTCGQPGGTALISAFVWLRTGPASLKVIPANPCMGSFVGRDATATHCTTRVWSRFGKPLGNRH